MANFSVGGIASGLDTDSIIAKLMSIERRPLTLLKERESSLNTKLGLYQKANSLLNALKSAATTIGTASTLQSASVLSSDTNTVTVTATSSPNYGTYSIGSVTSIARQSVHRSVGFSSQNTPIGGPAGSTLTLTVGSNTVTVSNYETKSLLDIRNEINNAGIGAQASVVDFSGTGTDYRLVVSATQTGTANAVTVTTDTGSLGMTMLQAASDLVFQFGTGGGAQTITRSSNTVSDLIEGVTLTFLQTKATATNISITPDVTQNVENVQAFVKAVNDLFQFFKDELTFDPNAKTQKPLVGDSTLNSIRTDVRSKLTEPVTGLGSSTITALSRLGITFDVDTGLMKVDTARLTEQLTNKPTEVVDFFEAFAAQLTNTSKTGLLDRITDSVDGTIATRIDGVNDEISRLQEAQAALEERLARKEELLRKQFIRLEQVIAQSQSQFSYFQSQLGILSNQRQR